MHMEQAAKPPIIESFKAGCNVVLHGRRGTLDMSRRVFLANRISGLCQVVTACKSRGTRGTS